MQKICKSLRQISTVTILGLASNFITEAADDIAAVINNNRLLESLHLSQNRLEAAGMAKITGALRNLRQLKKLDLTDNHFIGVAVDYIAEAIVNNSKLELLNLYNSQLNTNGMKKICEALSKVSTVKQLVLGKNASSIEASDNLAAMVLYNPLLE